MTSANTRPWAPRLYADPSGPDQRYADALAASVDADIRDADARAFVAHAIFPANDSASGDPAGEDIFDDRLLRAAIAAVGTAEESAVLLEVLDGEGFGGREYSATTAESAADVAAEQLDWLRDREADARERATEADERAADAREADARERDARDAEADARDAEQVACSVPGCGGSAPRAEAGCAHCGTPVCEDHADGGGLCPWCSAERA